MHARQTRNTLSCLMLLGCGFVLSGCTTQAIESFFTPAKLNQGNPDYRRVSLESEGRVPMMPTYVRPKYPDERFKVRGPEDSSSADTIRVSIRNVYIHRTSESSGGLSELAVLANVKVGSPISVSEPLNASRVFHYEEGVRHGEFLRFRDTPILFGPITYSGGDLHIRLSVMEMDMKDNEHYTGMIKTLAELGGTVYAPSAPVLSALEKIGSSLLKNNADDIDLDFKFTLAGWPQNDSTPKYASNWLTPGYYVIVVTDDENDKSKHDRAPRRLTQHVWDRLELDIDRGELVWKNEEGQDEEGEVRRFFDASYVVLAIEKGFDSAPLDTQETLASFRLKIEKSLTNDEQSRKEMAKQLEEAVRDYWSKTSSKENEEPKSANDDDGWVARDARPGTPTGGCVHQTISALWAKTDSDLLARQSGMR